MPEFQVLGPAARGSRRAHGGALGVLRAA